MSKTYPFEAVAVSAGKNNFMPGDRLELAADEAQVLLAAQAVRPLDPKTPASFFPGKKKPANLAPAPPTAQSQQSGSQAGSGPETSSSESEGNGGPSSND